MQKSVFSNKICLGRATLLSYILIALLRNTPLVHFRCAWFDGQMAIDGHFGIQSYIAFTTSKSLKSLPKLLPKSTDSCIALRCNYALCAFLNCGHCYNHASAAFLSQQGPVFNGRGQLWLFCSWVGFKMQPSNDHRLQLRLKSGRQFFFDAAAA